jgi:hypothetical protein
VLGNARQQVTQRAALEAATLLADEGSVDSLELRYIDAAQKWQDAADLVTFDPRAHNHYMTSAATALSMQGDEFGDNASLLASIAMYRRIVEHTFQRKLAGGASR